MVEKPQQPDTPQSILIVDVDEVVLKTLKLQLQDRGWDVLTAQTSAKALESFRDHRTTVALVAIGISDMDGVELAKALRQEAPDLIVILMTGYPALSEAVEELKNEAYDYLVKPFRIEQLSMGIERARRELALIRENRELKQTVAELQAGLERSAHPTESEEGEGEKAKAGEVTPHTTPYVRYPGKMPGSDSGAIASYERQISPTPSESPDEEQADSPEAADQEGE